MLRLVCVTQRLDRNAETTSDGGVMLSEQRAEPGATAVYCHRLMYIWQKYSRHRRDEREFGVKDSSGVNWAACITVTRPCRRSMSRTGCAGDFCRCGVFEAA